MRTLAAFMLLSLVACGGPVTGQRAVMIAGTCVGENRNRIERLYGEVTTPMNWGETEDRPYGCSISEGSGEGGSWSFMNVKSPEDCYEDLEVSGYDETCDTGYAQ